ncbi:MAG: outer membrane beta-barrel protein [Candidatus Saganbacteria bacterium]|nr:outer membrane beta-barrel protein [Candidatus Saganbacteria bacterium]
MKKITVVSVVLLGLFILSQAAFAEWPNNIYIGGGLGYFAPSNADISDNFDAGICPYIVGEFLDVFGNGIGFKSSLGYYSVTHKDINDLRLTIVPYNLSVIYSLNPKEMLSYYIGAGVANYSVYLQDSDNIYVKTGLNVGYHVSAGVDYKLSDTLKANVEIIDNFVKFTKEGVLEDKDMGSYMITVGLAYNLTPPAPPQAAPTPPPPPPAVIQPVTPEKPALPLIEQMRLRNRLEKINYQLQKEEVFVNKLKWRLANEKMTPANRVEAEKILKFHQDIVVKLNIEKADILSRLE